MASKKIPPKTDPIIIKIVLIVVSSLLNVVVWVVDDNFLVDLINLVVFDVTVVIVVGNVVSEDLKHITFNLPNNNSIIQTNL